MSNLEYFKRTLLDRIDHFGHVEVPWRILEDLLKDLGEEETSFGVSKNEIIMLAGHKRPQSIEDGFETWLVENNLQYRDTHHQTRVFEKRIDKYHLKTVKITYLDENSMEFRYKYE